MSDIALTSAKDRVVVAVCDDLPAATTSLAGLRRGGVLPAETTMLLGEWAAARPAPLPGDTALLPRVAHIPLDPLSPPGGPGRLLPDHSGRTLRLLAPGLAALLELAADEPDLPTCLAHLAAARVLLVIPTGPPAVGPLIALLETTNAYDIRSYRRMAARPLESPAPFAGITHLPADRVPPPDLGDRALPPRETAPAPAPVTGDVSAAHQHGPDVRGKSANPAPGMVAHDAYDVEGVPSLWRSAGEVARVVVRLLPADARPTPPGPEDNVPPLDLAPYNGAVLFEV